ncbi:MAG: phosphotransferase [Deltaproteobacteria bacterium]|nr:phosphotransferase [Deltaproteobacteria bacterium]
MTTQDGDRKNLIESLLRTAKLLAPGQSLTCRQFAGDGSDRQFFRCVIGGDKSFVIIFPSETLPEAIAEAKSSFAIGSHLYAMGLPVPKPYAIDKETGTLIFADLGNILLYDAAGAGANQAIKISLYRQALKSLAALQIKGREGFNPDWCWDTRHYDQEMMLERESHYFSREFCQGYMSLVIPAGLENDFLKLAARISEEPADYLMHRDFQARNLLIVDGRPWIIDFQGARFGPLGYDLASLLNDPYMDLAADIRHDLREYYITCVSSYITIDPGKFMAGYYHIALQRNLQVLGAYAYLTLARGKSFFEPYIRPAARNLVNILTRKLPDNYPELQRVSHEIYDKLEGNHSA